MAELISRTGRVQSWLDDPDGRLPVSCTVFVVDDTMEGPEGIEASWRFASHALRNGAGCAIHLSRLRPKGDDNGKGLVASGPVSFGKIYSTLNEILRRGGKYKNGAIVLHLDASHPDIDEFITTPREQLAWVKRCVNITDDWWENMDVITRQKLIKGIKAGDIYQHRLVVNRAVIDWDFKSNPEAPPEERLLYMLFYQMSRMCREKGAVKHDDRLDALAQGIKYFTDALAISADEQMRLDKLDDWNDAQQAWLDDPQAAANHMAFGMNLATRKQARQLSGQTSIQNWV